MLHWSKLCAVLAAADLKLLSQDKEGKIAYLQKMIDCVSASLGAPVEARPAKVCCTEGLVESFASHLTITSKLLIKPAKHILYVHTFLSTTHLFC